MGMTNKTCRSRFSAHTVHPNTGDICARPVEAGDKAEFDWVGAGDKDDGNGRRRRFGRERRCYAPHRDDDGHLTSNQIGRQGGDPIILTLRPAVVDGHVPALDVAEFVQPYLESGHEMDPFGG
jgi:hypothetical protein